jgi:hypothetical protein
MADEPPARQNRLLNQPEGDVFPACAAEVTRYFKIFFQTD